jgi:predicted metalloprotease with PDZ domain
MPAGAQTRTPQARVYTSDSWSTEEHRAALGVSTTATGTLRDTLGVMIASITRGSPAERAGLEEGNRIAAINGVSLRANAADIEDAEISGTLTRRLSRELAKSKPGDEVDLRVYRDGRTTSMKVRTADSDSLFRRPATTFTRADRATLDERPVLGLSLGSTGSRRDSLGVLVMSVSDSTPAARAGIEEGNRIAAINGINLRVAPEDAGDRWVSSAKAQRLQREISQLKPGTEVTLRVYSNGQFRDVRLKVARAGDLPRDASRVMILGGNDFGMMPAIAPMAPMPPMAPMAPRMPSRIRMMAPPAEELRFELGPEFRQQMNMLSDELRLLGPELESIGPALEKLRPELDRIRTELPAAVRRARVDAIRAQS